MNPEDWLFVSNDTILIHMQIAKLSVSIRKSQLKAGGCSRISGSHFGEGIFKTPGQINSLAILFAAKGIDEGFSP